jgi:SanA protein
MTKLKNRLKRIQWKKVYRKSIEIGIVLVLFILIVPQIIYASVKKTYDKKTYSNIEDVEGKKVAIVFGAAIWDEDTPSDILKDRIQVAVDLYNGGKIEKIIMSGDNRFIDYDEPKAMISYAKKLGVPEEVMQPDYAGRRTYDTCYRAKYVFGLDEAILVTQDFHLPRALYICNNLGVDSVGVSADLHEYVYASKMKFRDVYALSLALWDVNVRKPDVVLGEKIEL